MLVLFSFHNLLVAFCLLLADLVLAYQPKKKKYPSMKIIHQVCLHRVTRTASSSINPCNMYMYLNMYSLCNLPD